MNPKLEYCCVQCSFDRETTNKLILLISVFSSSNIGDIMLILNLLLYYCIVFQLASEPTGSRHRPDFQSIIIFIKIYQYFTKLWTKNYQIWKLHPYIMGDISHNSAILSTKPQYKSAAL